VELVIENIGAGPAYDLTFNTTDDWEIISNPRHTLAEMSLIKNGIRYLAPRQKLRFLIGTGVEAAKRQKKSFDLQVAYRSASGETPNEIFTVSFDHLIGMIGAGTPSEERLTRAIEKLSENVERWSTGFQKLNVELWTQDDIRKRDADLRSYYDERAGQNSPQPDAKAVRAADSADGSTRAREVQQQPTPRADMVDSQKSAAPSQPPRESLG
jgi:hypothetical protein